MDVVEDGGEFLVGVPWLGDVTGLVDLSLKNENELENEGNRWVEPPKEGSAPLSLRSASWLPDLDRARVELKADSRTPLDGLVRVRLSFIT